MCELRRGRHNGGSALLLAGFIFVALTGDSLAQSWELEREQGVGGVAAANAVVQELARTASTKAAPARTAPEGKEGVAIVITPGKQPVIRAAEGDAVDPFTEIDKRRAGGSDDAIAEAVAPVADVVNAPETVAGVSPSHLARVPANRLNAEDIRLLPLTANDLLGYRQSAPAPATSSTTAVAALPVARSAPSRSVVEQVQFAPNAIATPNVIVPPRTSEQASPQSRPDPIFLPSPRKPDQPVPGQVATATVQQVQLAPSIARAPKTAALRVGPTPDNQLVELVETPSEQALSLSAGRGHVLNLGKAVTDVFVADPEIADVKVVSPRQLVVHGNQLGRTNIFGIGAGGDIVFGLDLEVVPDAKLAQAELKSLSPEGNTNIQLVSNQLVADGTVNDVGEALQVAALSEQLAATQGPTVNNTVISGSQQVNIRVRFAEVSRTDVFNLGVNWEALSNTGDFLFGLATGPDIGDLGRFLGDQQGVFGSADFGDVNVEAFIDALQQEGLINLLAEPNLTAINGETANFLAGGEIPIPVPGGSGNDNVTIQFKPFGVSLDFIPTILPGDRINLRVRPEVSSLNGAGSILLDGFSIPAFTVRRAETSVELASGQTFAIAGLFQRDITTDTDKFPVLGDVPILGQLFQSQRFKRSETELVILITPYLVKPTSNRNIALPNDRIDQPVKPLARKKSNRRAGFIVN